jgi:hypothetical protein
MKKTILLAVAVLTIAATAQAKNVVYRDKGSTMESEGYKLFVSDTILNTVEKVDPPAVKAYCADAEENTAKHIGAISAVRTDDRLPLDANAKISYSAACRTYYTVLDRFKTADDMRRLWLLFADAAVDEYALEALKNHSTAEDAAVLIEMKRLNAVAKYIEFFYAKNKEWKLTDYTFLSQAFKSRKEKPLSPAFSQFIGALLTSDTEKAFQAVTSVDLDNLGARFIPTGYIESVKSKATPAPMTSRE